jgi:ABC-type lipoprotein export system ATPase subunit
MMALPHIIVRDLQKVFLSGGEEIAAIDCIDLQIHGGEFVSITGHSGSGKTTLLSVLGGLLRPTSGTVLVNGENIYGSTADGLARYRAQKVGFVFQSAGLLPALTVMDNLLLPSLYTSAKGGESPAAQARSHLADVGLLEKADAFPFQLSGGEAKRVSLVRSLMNSPEILLADEPTGDLDETTEEQVMGFLERFHRETGATFILVTHNPEIAGRAGRRIKMTKGKIETAAG